MSCRIFVVCEDHTLDEHVAVPVVEAMADAAGRPCAKVKIVHTPYPRGIEGVLKSFNSLCERYAVLGDLVVFALDADGLDGSDGRTDRRAVLEARRRALPDEVSNKVVVVLARQELEVWAMWGARARIPAGWSSIRDERDPKDVYWSGLIAPSDATVPGKGRRRLIEETLALGWTSVCEGCPELAEATQEMRGRLAGPR